MKHLWHDTYARTYCGLIKAAKRNRVAKGKAPTCLRCAQALPAPMPPIGDIIVRQRTSYALIVGDTLSVGTDGVIAPKRFVLMYVMHSMEVDWLHTFADGHVYAVDRTGQHWPIDLPA